MTFDAFIKQGWNDHGDDAQAVADRLASSFALIQTPTDIAPFAKLATHVYGEHLGQWSAGIALLELLRGLPAWDGSPEVAGVIANGIAVLRYAGGDITALALLPAADRILVLATASSALLGRHEYRPALNAFAAALELAGQGLPPDSPAIRALAIGGNNLAAALEEKPQRTESETEGMIAAAEAGLRYWKLTGTWLEEERAEYRLARSLLQACQHERAVIAARRCIELCSKNQAPPFELFFGHAVLALALRPSKDKAAFADSRTQALHYHDLVPQAEKQWCETEIKELRG